MFKNNNTYVPKNIIKFVSLPKEEQITLFNLYQKEIIIKRISKFFYKNALWLENEMDDIIKNKFPLDVWEENENKRLENLEILCGALGKFFAEYANREVEETEKIYKLYKDVKLDDSLEIIIEKAKKENQDFLQKIEAKVIFKIFILEDQRNKQASGAVLNKYLLSTKDEQEAFFSRNFKHEKDAEEIIYKYTKMNLDLFKQIIHKGENGEFSSLIETKKMVSIFIDDHLKAMNERDVQDPLDIEQQRIHCKNYCLALWKQRFLQNEMDIYLDKIQKFLI